MKLTLLAIFCYILFGKIRYFYSSESWEVLKYKFLEKISSENRSQFLMIFGGSSVTAGEDNTFLSAYPQVFERRMKPVLSALGVDLVVRDIAQTANQCIPSELCYNAMGGENADFIGWEQSFNCGREPAMFEIIARIAGFQGAVLHFEASGTELVDGCADSKTKPYRVSEDWSPEVDEDIQAQLKMQKTDHRALNEAAKEPLADLPYSPYIPNKEAVIAFKKLLTLWGDKANSIIRFSSPLGEKYKVSEFVVYLCYSVAWPGYVTVTFFAL